MNHRKPEQHDIEKCGSLILIEFKTNFLHISLSTNPNSPYTSFAHCKWNNLTSSQRYTLCIFILWIHSGGFSVCITSWVALFFSIQLHNVNYSILSYAVDTDFFHIIFSLSQFLAFYNNSLVKKSIETVLPANRSLLRIYIKSSSHFSNWWVFTLNGIDR